jgi:hypothetical protein
MSADQHSARTARLLKLLTAASEPITSTSSTAATTVAPVNPYSSAGPASEIVLHEDTVERERALAEVLSELARAPDHSDIGARVRYVYDCLDAVDAHKSKRTHSDDVETSPEEDLAYALTALSDAISLTKAVAEAAPSTRTVQPTMDAAAFDPFRSAQRITVEDVLTTAGAGGGSSGGGSSGGGGA